MGTGSILSRFTVHGLSCLREDLRGLAHVARGGGDDGARVDVDLLALLDGAAHVVLADEVDGALAVAGGGRGRLLRGGARGGLRVAVAAAVRRLRGRRGLRVRG